jgi:hypothetical protein
MVPSSLCSFMNQLITNNDAITQEPIIIVIDNAKLHASPGHYRALHEPKTSHDAPMKSRRETDGAAIPPLNSTGIIQTKPPSYSDLLPIRESRWTSFNSLNPRCAGLTCPARRNSYASPTPLPTPFPPSRTTEGALLYKKLSIQKPIAGLNGMRTITL